MDEILRKFTAETQMRGTANKRFKTATGMFFFPEGICPFCKSVIKSNRIWKASLGRLHARWKINKLGRKRILKNENLFARLGESIHPHVQDNSVCMGISRNTEGDGTSQALFLGMYPAGSYWAVNKRRWFGWLRTVWDHDCPSNLSRTVIRRRGNGRNP